MQEQGEMVTLGDAVDAFVGVRRNGQELRQALTRFLRWFGDDKVVGALTPAELEAYSFDASAETLGGGERIKAVRDFLQHACKAGLVDVNLSVHVKLRRAPRQSRPRSARQNQREAEVAQLTAEGHADLVKLAESLRDKMALNAKEIQRAAADKDVRENAPLEAAREYQGQLTSQLRATEDTLAHARVLDMNEGNRLEVRHGSTFTLEEVDTGAVSEWTIVDPREADMLVRKISTNSPVGEAVLGRRMGDEVEVSAPRGTLRFRVTHVG